MIENIEELDRWIEQMSLDAKKKLGVSDETLALVLMRHSLDYYVRSVAQRALNNSEVK